MTLLTRFLLTSPMMSPGRRTEAAGPFSSTPVTMTPETLAGMLNLSLMVGVRFWTPTPRIFVSDSCAEGIRAAALSSGSSPTLTLSTSSFDSRMTLTSTVVSGSMVDTIFRNCLVLALSLPLNMTITSPRFMPALSAGPPSTTSAIRTPVFSVIPKDLDSSGVKGWMFTPSQPRTILPFFMRLSMTVLAMLVGMAKPMPWYPPLVENMAVLIPTSSPLMLTRAPPELPGLMAASIWMKSS
ncbi:hypothetical protein MBAV_005276 [Candidatus Magnetobacterium bavaricum]|uniref:Uncharacterized protein n=1 Tax=Candidatus Magnetobacterium bavaricum TaxID=29290 RepID=A0A0F3GKT1_9BACT|nr:hypothetical protein MBAV_005276 [Candidatus Magnetobacterium bavaricum]